MKSATETVFARTPPHEHEKIVALKRLGSPLHYRFYFALTGPKTVMSDADFGEIIRLAGEDIPGLETSLKEQVRMLRHSGKTWFEHILDRLDEGVVSGLGEETLAGLVTGICETMDEILKVDNRPRFGSLSVARLGGMVVGRCMRRLAILSATRHRELAHWITAECSSVNWLVGDLLRDELFRHGRVGDGQQRTTPEEWAFSDELLDELLDIAAQRISKGQLQDKILDMPDTSGFMYGWRDIAGEEPPRAWAAEVTADDEAFIKFLIEMRGYAMSDRVYYPLHRHTLEMFFADADAVIQRLNGLLDGEYEARAREIQTAIEQARHL